MRCGHGAGILPDASLQRAAYEVQVMRQLTACEDLRVPKLLDHQRGPRYNSIAIIIIIYR